MQLLSILSLIIKRTFYFMNHVRWISKMKSASQMIRFIDMIVSYLLNEKKNDNQLERLYNRHLFDEIWKLHMQLKNVEKSTESYTWVEKEYSNFFFGKNMSLSYLSHNDFKENYNDVSSRQSLVIDLSKIIDKYKNLIRKKSKVRRCIERSHWFSQNLM